MIDVVRNSLKIKLVLIFLAVALVPVVIVGVAGYRIGKAANVEADFHMLSTVREMQARVIVDFLHDQVGTAKFLAHYNRVALVLQNSTLSKKEESQKTTGAGGKPEDVEKESNYSRLNEMMTDFVELYKRDGYHDVLLVKPDGEVVYSVKRLSDLGANLRTGAIRDSGLAKAWERAVKTRSHAIADYGLYQPANEPSSFVATPVFSEKSKEMCGALVLRMGPERINEIMRLPDAAGKTTETYLVGPDKLMRSQSRFTKDSTFLKTKIDTSSVKIALEDKIGRHMDTDFRGEAVLSAYGDARISEDKDMGADFEWAVLAEIEKSEVEEHVVTMAWTIFGIGLAVAAIVAGFAFFLAGSLSKPITLLSSAAEEVSKGNLNVVIPELKRTDELGALGRAFAVMARNLKDQIGRVLEGVNVLTSAAAEIGATVAQVATSTSQTSSALTETTTTVEEVKQSARLSSDKAKAVAEQAREAVEVTEAGRKAIDDTAQQMSLIRNQMESIGETVVRLSEHSQAIGNIVGAVQDLADQSNLLAVNASIEAARAGDQGKGFAVVAQEIKSLADQSKGATQQISGILEETRKWVSAVVMATEQGTKAVQAGVQQSDKAGQVISVLSNSVFSSNQSATVIQTASEQQFVGVDQVSTAMGSIEQAMRQIKDSTGQLETAAQGLGELGTNLKDLVQHYRM